MVKYKSYNYSQNVLIPVSLSEQITPGALDFAIQVLVEERMNMTRFDGKFNNDETGCKAYNPKIFTQNNIVGIFTGDNSFEEHRKGVQEKCSIHGTELWSGSCPHHKYFFRKMRVLCQASSAASLL